MLATPNLPEAWYPAIVARPSRFDRSFEISLSRERERYLAGKFGAQLDANAREEIVRLTSGMSMAFLQEIFVGAALRAMDRGSPPNAEDAREVRAGLVRHARAADRSSTTDAKAGFSR